MRDTQKLSEQQEESSKRKILWTKEARDAALASGIAGLKFNPDDFALQAVVSTVVTHCIEEGRNPEVIDAIEPPDVLVIRKAGIFLREVEIPSLKIPFTNRKTPKLMARKPAFDDLLSSQDSKYYDASVSSDPSDHTAEPMSRDDVVKMAHKMGAVMLHEATVAGFKTPEQEAHSAPSMFGVPLSDALTAPYKLKKTTIGREEKIELLSPTSWSAVAGAEVDARLGKGSTYQTLEPDREIRGELQQAESDAEGRPIIMIPLAPPAP